MKDKIKYIVLIIIFSLFVFSLTISKLLIKYDDNGVVNVFKEYYDIIFTNPSIDYDSEISVKINNEKDFLHIDIPDLGKYKRIEISLDANNIGNIPAIVESMTISNIDSSVSNEEINVDISLSKDNIIKGGESKKVNIIVTYDGKEKEVFYNFNINYVFNKVNL